VAGETNSFGTGKWDVWVLRLDSNGNVKWQKTYGGEWYDIANAVAVAPNGDVIVAGHYGADDPLGTRGDVWILRLDSNGNVKWQKTYGGSYRDGAYAVAIAENGDIIVAGETESFGAGDRDFWVLRLDAEGNVKWQKTYGGSNLDGANAVAIAENGDIIVVGSTTSFGAGFVDAWVLRLDENGNIKWQKTYGGDLYDSAYAVAIAPNGDIIATGYDLLRLSLDGELKWAMELGGDDIKVLPDGTVVLVGGNTVVRFNVDEVPNYSGWEGWNKVSREVHESNAEVHATNATVLTSNAEIHDTNAEVHDTNAEVKTLWAYTPPRIISDLRFYLLTPWETPNVINLQELPSSRTLEFEIWAKSSTGGKVNGKLLIFYPNATIQEMPVNITLNKEKPTILTVPWKLPLDVLPGTYSAALFLYSPYHPNKILISDYDSFYFEDPDRSYIQVMLTSDGKKIVHVHLQRYSLKTSEYQPSYVEFLEMLNFDEVSLGKGALEVIKRNFKGITTSDHPVDRTFIFMANSSKGYVAYMFETHPLDIVKKEVRDITLGLIWTLISSSLGIPAISAPPIISIPAKIASTVVFIPKTTYDRIPTEETYYELHPPVEMMASISRPRSVKLGNDCEVSVEYKDPRDWHIITGDMNFTAFLKGETSKIQIPVEIHKLGDSGAYILHLKTSKISESGEYTVILIAYKGGYYSEVTWDLEIKEPSSSTPEKENKSTCGPGTVLVLSLLAALIKRRNTP